MNSSESTIKWIQFLYHYKYITFPVFSYIYPAFLRYDLSPWHSVRHNKTNSRQSAQSPSNYSHHRDKAFKRLTAVQRLISEWFVLLLSFFPLSLFPLSSLFLSRSQLIIYSRIIICYQCNIWRTITFDSLHIFFASHKKADKIVSNMLLNRKKNFNHIFPMDSHMSDSNKFHNKSRKTKTSKSA